MPVLNAGSLWPYLFEDALFEFVLFAETRPILEVPFFAGTFFTPSSKATMDHVESILQYLLVLRSARMGPAQDFGDSDDLPIIVKDPQLWISEPLEIAFLNDHIFKRLGEMKLTVGFFYEQK